MGNGGDGPLPTTGSSHANGLQGVGGAGDLSANANGDSLPVPSSK